MEGEVMFHEYIQKTEEEKELIKKSLAEKKYVAIAYFIIIQLLSECHYF